MAVNCRAATAVLNEKLRKKDSAAEFLELWKRNATPEEVAEAITSDCDETTASVIRTEFRELPRSFLTLWLTLWRMANESGQTFELISEPAARPLEYARAGRVAYRIENDLDGVRMYVSHVEGHHADWFKPAAELVAVG
jgi:hypothetical protein